MRKSRTSPYLLPAVIAVALLGAAAWIYYAFPCRGEDQAAMLKETYKLLLQVILVGIVGGLALKQWEAQRAASIDQETFVQGFRKQVAETYFHTKRARRLLKARASREGGAAIGFEFYEEKMLDINDQQLALETAVRELEARARDFEDFERIKDDLKSMEIYLRALVREYQYESPDLAAGAGAPVTIASHPRLQEFIADVTHAVKGEFDTRFAFRFSDVLRALRGEPPREATPPAR